MKGCSEPISKTIARPGRQAHLPAICTHLEPARIRHAGGGTDRAAITRQSRRSAERRGRNPAGHAAQCIAAFDARNASTDAHTGSFPHTHAHTRACPGHTRDADSHARSCVGNAGNCDSHARSDSWAGRLHTGHTHADAHATARRPPTAHKYPSSRSDLRRPMIPCRQHPPWPLLYVHSWSQITPAGPSVSARWPSCPGAAMRALTEAGRASYSSTVPDFMIPRAYPPGVADRVTRPSSTDRRNGGYTHLGGRRHRRIRAAHRAWTERDQLDLHAR
jgi:hypothetical protein